jgi:hypothetical protein
MPTKNADPLLIVPVPSPFAFARRRATAFAAAGIA